MHDRDLAVAVASRDGSVIAVNRAARRMFGDGVGKACREMFVGAEGACGLPCIEGCVSRLLGNGLGHARHAVFEVGSERFRLSCVPVEGVVVCTVSRQACSRPNPWERLTPRERQVLELLAAGGTTASVAGELGLSRSTVRAHVEHMRVRFDVRTRAALVARVLRTGLLY